MGIEQNNIGLKDLAFSINTECGFRSHVLSYSLPCKCSLCIVRMRPASFHACSHLLAAFHFVNDYVFDFALNDIDFRPLRLNEVHFRFGRVNAVIGINGVLSNFDVDALPVAFIR